jgi:hypothetical protein
MDMWKRYLYGILITLLVGPLLRAQTETIPVPEGRELALAGILTEVHGYGPPGYGEDKRHDARITYWVLELQTSINTPCTPERPEWASLDCMSTKRLRLFFPTLPEKNGIEQKARLTQGEKVLVSGVLHRRDTANEITPIYMDVTDIQPVKKVEPSN